MSRPITGSTAESVGRIFRRGIPLPISSANGPRRTPPRARKRETEAAARELDRSGRDLVDPQVRFEPADPFPPKSPRPAATIRVRTARERSVRGSRPPAVSAVEPRASAARGRQVPARRPRVEQPWTAAGPRSFVVSSRNRRRDRSRVGSSRTSRSETETRGRASLESGVSPGSASSACEQDLVEEKRGGRTEKRLGDSVAERGNRSFRVRRRAPEAPVGASSAVAIRFRSVKREGADLVAPPGRGGEASIGEKSRRVEVEGGGSEGNDATRDFLVRPAQR